MKSALSEFILSNLIQITKTKSGKGFMIYNLSEQPDFDSAKLTSLASSVKWSVKKWSVQRDKDDNIVRDACLYVGPQTSSWDVDKDSVADFLNAQIG